MLANFLNKSKPINFIGLLIFFFVGLLYTIFYDGYTPNKLLQSVSLLFIFLIIFFIFNFINSKNGLTFDNSYAYFLFIILTICISSELIEYPVLLKIILYLLFLRKIYSLRSSKKLIEKFFDSGFWLGILFILEPFTLFFSIPLYVAIYLHHKITVHSLFTPIIGFVVPLIIFFTYSFWYENTDPFYALFNFKFNFDISFYRESKYLWFIGSILCCSILAILFKSVKTLSINNTFRKSWIVLITNFSIAILFFCSLPQKNGSELIFMLFPAAIILANGIELIQKKIFKDILLYFFLAASIVMNYFL